MFSLNVLRLHLAVITVSTKSFRSSRSVIRPQSTFIILDSIIVMLGSSDSSFTVVGSFNPFEAYFI